MAERLLIVKLKKAADKETISTGIQKKQNIHNSVFTNKL